MDDDPQARSADQRLRALIHDLRTPLAIVTGFAELLLARAETLTPEQRRDYVERTQAAAQQMAALLDGERGGSGPPR